jgi:hypothetical protein
MFLLASAVPSRCYPSGIDSNDEDLEIENLITSQVQSPIGHQFVKYFNEQWISPVGLPNMNIIVSERASPIWGSLLWIKVNENVVYRQVFSSRARDLKEAAKNAVHAVLSYMFTTRLNNDDDTIDEQPLEEQ